MFSDRYCSVRVQLIDGVKTDVIWYYLKYKSHKQRSSMVPSEGSGSEERVLFSEWEMREGKGGTVTDRGWYWLLWGRMIEFFFLRLVDVTYLYYPTAGCALFSHPTGGWGYALQVVKAMQ